MPLGTSKGVSIVSASSLAAGVALGLTVCLLPAPAWSLRRAVPLDDSALASPWTTGSECEASYFNVCTGWVWVWTYPDLPNDYYHHWTNRDRVGVVVDSCCEGAQLTSTWTYFNSGFPAGYGYSMVSIQAVDASDCPSGTPIAQHVRLPVTGWNFDTWDVPVPSRFAVAQELRTDWPPSGPYVFVTTDHPAARGGEGPACGTCYPTTRATHSFYWGRASAPLCPGAPFFDGTCNAEILLRASFACATGVEPRTWAGIKALYR